MVFRSSSLLHRLTEVGGWAAPAGPQLDGAPRWALGPFSRGPGLLDAQDVAAASRHGCLQGHAG